MYFIQDEKVALFYFLSGEVPLFLVRTERKYIDGHARGASTKSPIKTCPKDQRQLVDNETKPSPKESRKKSFILNFICSKLKVFFFVKVCRCSTPARRGAARLGFIEEKLLKTTQNPTPQNFLI